MFRSTATDLKAWLKHWHFVLKRTFLPVSLRQQQPSGRNLAFLIAHASLCCVVRGFVLRTVAMLFSICSELPKYNFFRIIQCFFSILNLSQTHFDVQWPCNDALPKYGCSKISFPFGPSYHLTKFGHGVFGHPAGWLISCAQKFSWVWPVSR